MSTVEPDLITTELLELPSNPSGNKDASNLKNGKTTPIYDKWDSISIA